MKRRDFLATSSMLTLLSLCGCGNALSDRETTFSSVAPFGKDITLRDAFFYAYPIYEIARTAQERTGALNGKTGRLNLLSHRAILLDHNSRVVTGPNNDTIYSSAFLELSGGPMELFVPTELERYYSIAFMNILTDNFAYIGTRATKGIGGKFWVVGPNWSGDVPADVKLIRCDSNDVWMLGRTLVSGRKDLPEAQAFQQAMSLTAPASRPPARPFTVNASGELDAKKLLSVVNEMIARSPGGLGELARVSDYANFGIGSPENITSDLLAKWDAFLPQGIEELREAFIYRDLVIDGWAYQERGVGEFGRKDKLRAAVALGGLAALGEKEAMYFHANLDPNGERLSGEHRYRWRIPPGGVPADAFWSLTMYETFPDGRFFLVDNPINRYAIGDRTEGLIVEPDGSFEIIIQHESPEGKMAANWLPAPKGGMRLALRAYMPSEELLNRTWKVPPLVKVE